MTIVMVSLIAGGGGEGGGGEGMENINFDAKEERQEEAMTYHPVCI